MALLIHQGLIDQSLSVVCDPADFSCSDFSSCFNLKVNGIATLVVTAFSPCIAAFQGVILIASIAAWSSASFPLLCWIATAFTLPLLSITTETTALFVVMPRWRSSVGMSVRALPSSTRLDLVYYTGGVERPLGQAGLTGVYVRQDPQVQSSHGASCPLGRRELPSG